jgi:hypothetical protein
MSHRSGANTNSMSLHSTALALRSVATDIDSSNSSPRLKEASHGHEAKWIIRFKFQESHNWQNVSIVLRAVSQRLYSRKENKEACDEAAYSLPSTVAWTRLTCNCARKMVIVSSAITLFLPGETRRSRMSSKGTIKRSESDPMLACACV